MEFFLTFGPLGLLFGIPAIVYGRKKNSELLEVAGVLLVIIGVLGTGLLLFLLWMGPIV
jgi:hypothetical protein